MDDRKKITDGGKESEKLYDVNDPHLDLPFRRGVQPGMYAGKLWAMRQSAGFSTPEECNKRLLFLVQQGVTDLSVAFDTPTQLGYDSDHVMAEGQVGRAGVTINSLEDMEILFTGINLEDISIAMTTSATGFILLAFYVALAKKQGVDLKKIKGTLQNDALKEYVTKGICIYPPKPSLRIIHDVFEWCGVEVPEWNTLTVSGYHIREAGSTAAQEIAFALSNAKAYVLAALERNLDINVFGKRLSFHFSAQNNLFEEVAKFRAARRMWARIMQDLGATDENAIILRFHSQTGSGMLTHQQPLNNISRVTMQALSAVLGGTHSLETNGYDKPLCHSSEEAATIALRTQQILAFESGIGDTADPLAGSYFVEALTDEVETKAMQLVKAIDAMGGSVSAIQQGFMQDEISRSAHEYEQKVQDGEKIIVGVNKFESADRNEIKMRQADELICKERIQRLDLFRQRRDPARCDSILQGLNDRAAGDENIMPAVLEAAENKCTLGEIADTLREVYGEYRG